MVAKVYMIEIGLFNIKYAYCPVSGGNASRPPGRRRTEGKVRETKQETMPTKPVEARS